MESQWAALPMGILFIQSLLIWWFLSMIMESYDADILMQLLRGLAILFIVFIPVFLVIEGFQNSTPAAGFFIPLILYVLTIPLFDSLLTHVSLLTDTSVIIPQLTGGVGFGFVGIGSYNLKRRFFFSFACITAGITLVFLSAPDILRMFLSLLPAGILPLPFLP